MSDIYDAAREVRDVLDALDDTVSDRVGDVSEVLKVIASCLRDISDVLHAQYYGDKTRDEEALSDEE